MKKIELLAPAGDLEKLKIAVLYGADAVFAGLQGIGHVGDGVVANFVKLGYGGIQKGFFHRRLL